MATAMQRKIAVRVQQLRQEQALEIGLAVICVGDDPASKIYVSSKEQAAKQVGINSKIFLLEENTDQVSLIQLIHQLNKDDSVHGVLIQLPLPDHINVSEVFKNLSPEKDVDGLTHENAGRLFLGDDAGLKPCTPLGCIDLIKSMRPDLTGLRAVVIGRSTLVGNPLSQLLLQENCTVTIAHSRSKDLASLCQQADILVAAAGQPLIVTKDWIKQGAIVIDVGINRLSNGLIVGDVDFQSALEKAGSITPVPGGVGPMTIAYLLSNTVSAACAQCALLP